MANKFITTPIYYINDVPHLGHAYTSIAADVWARYERSKGEAIFFLTGTDEHGAKIAQAAEQAGEEPKKFADKISTQFEDLTKTLDISNDAFVRTTDPKHEKYVADFLQGLYNKKFIYKKEYEGLYCIGCEKYLTERDLIDGKCPDHDKAPEKQSEENWFFRLSDFKDEIEKLIESDEIEIKPLSRKNEILGKIKNGLDDVSISRKEVSWGIKVPWDETQTVYVWIDALINYLSATEIFEKKDFWPPSVHLVGRDIMWFHAVIWPAILLATGFKLPKKIFGHGYFTVDGKKMSKTIGNVIDPVDLVKKYGGDPVRYYVLRDFPFGEDGDVSIARLEERHNNDLASGLGNLVQRVLSLIKQNDLDLSTSGVNLSAKGKEINKLTEDLKFQEALIEIWKLIAVANKEIADVEPWKLAKENKKEELKSFLQSQLSNVLEIADLVEPYLPETAEEIKKQSKSLDLTPIFEKI